MWTDVFWNGKYVLNESDKMRYTRLGKAVFLTGYQASGRESKYFPSKLICDDYVKAQDDKKMACFWGGLLCSVLLQKYFEDQKIQENKETFLGEKQAECLCSFSSMPEKWLPWMEENQEKWETFLDRCDDCFNYLNIKVFIAYDELDRICSRYKDLFLYIRSLLNFWFTHNNRWQNLKAKIFLRSDLYDSRSLHFTDSSKMRAYRLELQWDSVSLYRLLIKRLANSGNENAVAYLLSIRDLLPDKKERIGYLPTDSECGLKAFVEKMIGRYMGKVPKRGISYNWVPNHIQDANGEVSPRAFLKCFVFAVLEQQRNKKELEELEDDHLLHPSRLQGALAEVSRDRVRELVEDEYIWLETLSRRLDGQSMLMNKTAFLQYLAIENWSDKDQEVLPATSPEELLDALEGLGIFYETEDGRINTPEIYLHGFGLKRRGRNQTPEIRAADAEH